MNAPNDRIRVKFAYYLENWSYESGDSSVLRQSGQKITPPEYLSTMENKLFCPVCFTNISRNPKNKAKFSNNRKACFMHRSSYLTVECRLRTPKTDGKQYLSEELAKHAIESDQLAIIHSFQDAPPALIDGQTEPYDQSAIEDIEGPVSDIPISRHSGEIFALPSKVTTVMGICRNFDQNLYKYFVFPGANIAFTLMESLTNVADLNEESEEPALYFGKIQSSFIAGNTPNPSNLRMTRLVYNNSNKSYKDFTLKAVAAEQQQKGIDDNSVGRIVVFWGRISSSGLGLAVSGLKWGEYALLPEKYNHLLIDED